MDQELLLRIEYLVTENRILRNQIQGRVRLSDGERQTLVTIGKQLSKQTLAEVATIVTPDTIVAWQRNGGSCHLEHHICMPTRSGGCVR